LVALTKHHADDNRYVYLIGSDKLSSELHAISEEANTKHTQTWRWITRFNAPDDPNRFYYRSDHYNFAKNNIPVIFYFSGVHEDYHRPGDDPEKVMYGKTAEIGRLDFSHLMASCRIKTKGLKWTASMIFQRSKSVQLILEIAFFLTV